MRLFPFFLAIASIACTDEKGTTTPSSFTACGAVVHGDTETRDCFTTATVPFDDTCVSTLQSRTCNDGVWDPDYPACANLTCSTSAPADCGPIAHGEDESRECFAAELVPHGETCTTITQSRTCYNGGWNPDWPGTCFTDCAVDLPPAGNPGGSCAIPVEAQLEDTSLPTSTIGDGTPASCTSEAVVTAIAGGGIITFNCGPDPITITLEETAKIFNDTGPEIVIDGGGLVTLSGGGSYSTSASLKL